MQQNTVHIQRIQIYSIIIMQLKCSESNKESESKEGEEKIFILTRPVVLVELYVCGES